VNSNPDQHNTDSGHFSLNKPSDLQQLLVWCRLGVQSFGGGTAALALIRRAVVDDYRWITPEDFTRYWALVLMVPGINLVGLIVLIGFKLRGARGVLVALSGLLPSVLITIMLTALYAKVQHSHTVAAAVSGVIPATVGVGIYTSWQMALPVLRYTRKLGTRSLAIALTLFAGSAVIESAFHLPVVVILLGAGAIGAGTSFVGDPIGDDDR
jgi:chromate transporter